MIYKRIIVASSHLDFVFDSVRFKSVIKILCGENLKMSSLPSTFYDPWNVSRPSYIQDQRFGSSMDSGDFSTTLIYPISYTTLGKANASNYCRPWRPTYSKDDYGSSLIFDKSKFQAILDVQQFAPNEITVKVIGQTNIVVEGKHDEKQDQHGYITRQFTRRYALPDGHDIDKIYSSLSSDGVLTISVPRINQIEEQRSIPIVQTGVPVIRTGIKTPSKITSGVAGKAPSASLAKTTGATLTAEPTSEPAKAKVEENKEEKLDNEKDE